MTLRQELALTLSYRTLYTCAELLDLMNSRSSRRWKISSATLSSLLHRMCESGEVLRLRGFGVRGGYGYVRSQL